MRINAKQLFDNLLGQLTLKETLEEKKAYVYWLLEHFLKLSKSTVLADAVMDIDEHLFDTAIHRLNRQEPIQYVLSEAWFFGRRFTVNSGVLIPRPETELLVEAALPGIKEGGLILDIGTGSGCLAITLALECPGSKVLATDISDQAIAVATANAASLGATVKFIRHDMLHEPLPFRELDLVVSNPPYVMEKEKPHLKENVKHYEPSLALFVPDDDPLQFHRSIAQQGLIALKSGGQLITEINESLSRETEDLFRACGYIDVRTLRDLQDKPRFTAGRRS